ncbi:MAG TPA: hypothetical protein VKF32_08960, partial [Thermoanaerobaculia bacterium]|nr:hypothetical protein [Thermoanaerobaculia bacterium]
MSDLLQIELPEVDLLLDLLKRGVADRAVFAQLDQPPPLRRRHGAHHPGFSSIARVFVCASLRAAEP